MRATGLRMHAMLPLLFAASGLTSWVSGCAARNFDTGDARSAATPEAECTVRETWRGPLKPAADQELYVEAEIMIPGDGEVLIAGRPTFLFASAGGSDTLLSRNEIFGVLVKSDRSVEVIPNPLGTDFVMPLTAGLIGPNEYGVIFAEIDPGQDTSRWTERNDGDFRRVMYAEYGGGRWRGRERVPMPQIGITMRRNASALVKHADTLIWAVPTFDNRSHGEVIERVGGAWTRRPVGPRIRAAIAYAEAGYVAGRGFLIALVHPDMSLMSDGNSLFLYRRDSAWVEEGKLIAGAGKPVHHPVWIQHPEVGSILSWVNPGSIRGNEARAAVGVLAAGEAQVIVVDSAAIDEPAALGAWNPGPFWISNHLDESGALHVRLSRARGSGSERLWSVVSPYTTSFAAVSTNERTALIAGPLLNREARKLTSLLIELQLECPPLP